MLSEEFIVQLGTVLQAQHHVLQNLEAATAEIDASLTDSTQKLASVVQTTPHLQEAEALLAELEADRNWIEPEDFGDFDPDQILRLYENRQRSVSRDLTRMGFKDWDSFVRQCQAYTLSRGIDPLAPYEAFLTEADLQRLQDESYEAQYRWDRWDYLFVGASGVLASLTDFLLVRIPQTLTAGEYKGQIGSPITAWFKQYNINNEDDWFAEWAKSLEKVCKVPYDSMTYSTAEGVKRLSPRLHRIQSLGHDPVLGFVFGVLDIMRGTMTSFSLTDPHKWASEAVWSNIEPFGLIEAMLLHIGHLISDVATPAGLPAPFMTLVQGIQVGQFGQNKRTVGDLARWMYLNGYDFRHFLVTGLTPAVIEIVLRAYIMLRHYSEHGETEFDLASHPKYRTMLLAAHGIATLGNAGKIALMQGNPLAINYAEWLALIRYLVPSIKYWAFEQHKLRLEHMERINAQAWDDLLQGCDRILETVAQAENASHIILGAN